MSWGYSVVRIALVDVQMVTGEFPSQRPVTRSFDVFFDLRLNKGRVNNREAGDLRRNRIHYDVTMMGLSPLGQNGRDFADDIFSCIFMNEKFGILIHISLKFVPGCPIGNIAALVQVMAWTRTGDKPLLEPMLTQFTDAYIRHKGEMS